MKYVKFILLSMLMVLLWMLISNNNNQKKKQILEADSNYPRNDIEHTEGITFKSSAGDRISIGDNITITLWNNGEAITLNSIKMWCSDSTLFNKIEREYNTQGIINTDDFKLSIPNNKSLSGKKIILFFEKQYYTIEYTGSASGGVNKKIIYYKKQYPHYQKEQISFTICDNYNLKELNENRRKIFNNFLFNNFFLLILFCICLTMLVSFTFKLSSDDRPFQILSLLCVLSTLFFVYQFHNMGYPDKIQEFFESTFLVATLFIIHFMSTWFFSYAIYGSLTFLLGWISNGKIKLKN